MAGIGLSQLTAKLIKNRIMMINEPSSFYGFKNFEFYNVLIGIGFIIVLVHLGFSRVSLFINSKFENKENLIRIKTVIEYFIIIAIVYYIFA